MDIDSLLRERNTNDSELAEAIMQIYFSSLFSLAQSLLDDPDEAEDAVQEAVIKAVRRIDRYRIGSNFRAWVVTICINTCRGQLRKNKAMGSLQTSLRVLWPRNHNSANPQVLAELDERDSILWESMRALDEKYRTPILLKVVHEIPAHEIATALGIKEKTVYTRMYEGFRRLRSELDGKITLGV